MGQSHMDLQEMERVPGEEAYEGERLVEAVVAAECEEDVSEEDEDAFVEDAADAGKDTVGQMDEEVEKEDHDLKGETVDAVEEIHTVVQANYLPVAAAEQMPLQQLQRNHAVNDPLKFRIDYPDDNEELAKFFCIITEM